MKLRNKKTGEIRKAEAREDGIYLWDEQTKHWWIYELDMLARGWEYYVEPKEPLIKDEKIRKAVRAWAGINGIDKVRYVPYGSNEHTLIYQRIGVDLWIQFESSIGELVENQFYTIAELCGDEEEC